MKAISPLIAAVLLIAFTVSISTIIMGFMSETTRETTADVSGKLDTIVDASDASLSIKNLVEYCGNYTLIVSNTGYQDFSNVSGLILFTDGTTCSLSNISISSGDVGLLTQTDCKDIVNKSQISEVIVTSELGGISDKIDDSSSVIQVDYEQNLLDGLVLWYDFSERGLVDLSGNENNCIIYNNAVFVENGIYFNATYGTQSTPQFVRTTNPVYTGTDSFSFHLKLLYNFGYRLQDPPSSSQINTAGLIENINGMICYFGITKDQKLYSGFYYGDDRSRTSTLFQSNGDITNKWINIDVVLEYDEENDKTILKFYQDGDLIGTDIIDYDFTGRYTGTTSKTKIGSLTTYRLDGIIDDVRFYNRTLSQEEISTLYNLYN